MHFCDAAFPLCHHTHAPTCHQIPLVSPEHSNDGEESGGLTSPKHLSKEPYYIHHETSDAFLDPGCVLEGEVSIILDIKELNVEVNGTIKLAADSNVMIFSPIKKAFLQAWRHPSMNPSHDSKSVCTKLTVDTIDSLDYTDDDEVILSLFPELFEFVSDLESELEATMDKVLRLNSDYCPLVATAPTIPMPSKST
jgi:hypothetical protein